MPDKIAFFDFDGTITNKDTVLEIARFRKKAATFYWGLMINAPLLIASKIKIISNQSSKERLLKYFFNGQSLPIFQGLCDAFISERLPTIIRPKALAEINKLKADGFKIVVVSASAENWIKGWCNKEGIDLLASKLSISNGLITGELDGKNCHGAEKVARIKEDYNLDLFNEIYCYGDTRGDKPMLKLATKAFYKPFRN